MGQVDVAICECDAGAALAMYKYQAPWPEFAVHGHTAKFMLCISGLRIGDRVPTSTPACPHGTTFLPLFHAVTRHNVCPQTANSGPTSLDQRRQHLPLLVRQTHRVLLKVGRTPTSASRSGANRP